MANRYISDLLGTLKSRFIIGGNSGISLKNNGGTEVLVRNAADSAYEKLSAKTVGIYGGNASNLFTWDAPTLSGNVTLKVPDGVGTAGQALLSDGAGGTYFGDVASNADLTQTEAFTEATSSPLAIFTPPANAYIRQVVIVISSAAGANSPTLTVGTAGTNDLYMAATENDVKTAGIYEVAPYASVGGSPAQINLYITPDSQTFSGRVFVVYTNPA